MYYRDLEVWKKSIKLVKEVYYLVNEFPDDEKCWEAKEQYMFGNKYLVAPVMYQGMTKRDVYLPEGTWKSIHDGTEYKGGTTITVDAPLDVIPVFERM